MNPMKRPFTSRTLASCALWSLVGSALVACGTEDPQAPMEPPTTNPLATVGPGGSGNPPAAVSPSTVGPGNVSPGNTAPQQNVGPSPVTPPVGVSPVNPVTPGSNTVGPTGPGDTTNPTVNPVQPVDTTNPVNPGATGPGPVDSTTQTDEPDTADTTSMDTTDTGPGPGMQPDPGPPSPGGNCTFTIEESLSPDISTVGIVNWSSDAALTSAQVEFSAESGGDTFTAPVDVASGPEYRTLLLGMKPDTTYNYRIVANDGALPLGASLRTARNSSTRSFTSCRP